MPNEDWSNTEVKLIVDDYFDMLVNELDHQQYNKSAHRNHLSPKLNHRSDGSIEFKHQNISAILASMGQPYIKGYKPRGNYQMILGKEVSIFLNDNWEKLKPKFELFANSFNSNPVNIDFSNIVDIEPAVSQVKEDEPTYRPVKVNYLEKEQNNRNLGEKGEELVMEYEKWRLIKAGKENLADKIEWISKDVGDGTGYDILSKNTNGTDRFVEVKTTKLSKETPIYLTRTEVSFATNNAKNFYLYRVFNFGLKPQLFIKNGTYTSFCELLPETFRGHFNC